MEKRTLPLSFYIRSARLLLKKAAFSRKSSLLADELRHLKKYSTLAFSVIPSHPDYMQLDGRKLAQELDMYSQDVRERIFELEDQLSLSTTSVSSARSPLLSPSAVSSSGSRGVSDAVPETEAGVAGEPVRSPKKRYIWEVFAKKLYETAAKSPCFSARQSKITGGTSSGFVPELLGASSETHGCLKCWKFQQHEDGDNRALENKVLGLQEVVLELRDAVEALRCRVEDEGKIWRIRTEGLENNIRAIRDDTEDDLSSLKQQVQTQRSEDHRLQIMWESSSVENYGSTSNTEHKVTKSLGELRSELKNDVNMLELGMSQDVDNLRQEMVSRFESLLIDVEMGRIGEQQQLKHKFDKMQVSDERKTGLDCLTAQIHALQTDLSSLRQDVAQPSIEHDSETRNLKQQLAGAMQEKIETEMLMKEFQNEITELKETLRVGLESASTKESTSSLQHEGEEGIQVVMERVERFTGLYTGCLSDLQQRTSRLEIEREENKVKLENASRGVENQRLLASSHAKDVLEELFGRKPKHRLKTLFRRLIRRMKGIVLKLTGSNTKLVVKPVKKDANDCILSKRVHRLEILQMNHGKWLQEVHLGHQSLEKAACLWLRKYEATTKLITEIETRVTLMELDIKPEESEQGRKPSDSLSSSTQTGQPLIRLESSSTQTVLPAVHSDTEPAVLEILRPITRPTSSSLCCHERLDSLENRVEHIAAVTYANLRLLDAKLDHVSTGTKSAMDIASETEDKCSSLAAELVRVFKLILSSRDASKKGPAKSLGCPLGTRLGNAAQENSEEPTKRLNLRLGTCSLFDD